MSIFKAWANVKTYYLRGFTYFGAVSTAVVLLLGVKGFYDNLASLGVPMLLFYGMAVAAVLFVPPLLGWFDLEKVSEHELKLTWDRTREASRMTKQVDELHRLFFGDDGK